MFVEQVSPPWCLRVVKIQQGGEFTRLLRVVEFFVKWPTDDTTQDDDANIRRTIQDYIRSLAFMPNEPKTTQSINVKNAPIIIRPYCGLLCNEIDSEMSSKPECIGVKLMC